MRFSPASTHMDSTTVPSSSMARKSQFRSIKDSEALGIGIIHQELALVPYLSIAENIFLGADKPESSA